jgi:hypothetical protein
MLFYVLFIIRNNLPKLIYKFTILSIKFINLFYSYYLLTKYIYFLKIKIKKLKNRQNNT